ncbi:DUF2920 family protein, partial [Campylobacter volucris]|uniref:DUF2920 family protein n=1 Tax=Campylobacter volucris TaxID=1031542 RepID=UPI0018A0E9C7
MLINKTYEINSCDDVELNIKRESKLEYRIIYDDSKEMKAIVFIIGGYGANTNMHFLESYRKFIAKKFDVVVVNVLYHCFCQRVSDVDKYSAQTAFMEDDLPHLKIILENFKIQTSRLDIDTAHAHYDFLCQTISNLKNKSLLEKDFRVHLYGSFIPPNNEYQNFGIMAAIDHINALKDIMKNYPQFKSLPKIYGGGSYGGYLALMCAKIAPWYVDGVIDNSGAGLPPINYIIGRDVQGCDCKVGNESAIIHG